MHVVLVEPQIPPNTGNIARLCAATHLPLHLVGKLGFGLTDRHLKRAGLDYWEHVRLERHRSLEDFLSEVPPSRLFFFSTKGRRSYVEATFHDQDILIFGSETQGLPAGVLERYQSQVWRVPILDNCVRSLNLANCVSIVVYEALRQLGKLEDE